MAVRKDMRKKEFDFIDLSMDLNIFSFMRYVLKIVITWQFTMNGGKNGRKKI